MSILQISLNPTIKPLKCLACKWVRSLSDDERAHLDDLLANYKVADLCRELRMAGVVVGESTFRKHINAGH
jgi:hypothetical protein